MGYSSCRANKNAANSLLNVFDIYSGLCIVLQVTKQRARTLITELHASMIKHQMTFDHGHCIDQMLYHFSAHNNLTWVVGSNFVSPQNDAHVGLFYQDRARFSSTLDG